MSTSQPPASSSPNPLHVFVPMLLGLDPITKESNGQTAWQNSALAQALHTGGYSDLDRFGLLRRADLTSLGFKPHNSNRTVHLPTYTVSQTLAVVCFYNYMRSKVESNDFLVVTNFLQRHERHSKSSWLIPIFPTLLSSHGGLSKEKDTGMRRHNWTIGTSNYDSSSSRMSYFNLYYPNTPIGIGQYTSAGHRQACGRLYEGGPEKRGILFSGLIPGN